MILIFREDDGVTGARLTLGEKPIANGDILYRSGRYIAGIDPEDLSGNLDHAKLINLNWADADHTIDADVEFPDNISSVYGTGGDSGIYYDGSDLIFDSQLVGAGNFKFINGSVRIGTAGAPVSLLEVYDNAAHPIITITGAHASSYDPQIQFRTDAAPAVKASVGFDNNDNKFKIIMGAGGVRGGTGFVIDILERLSVGTNSASAKLHIRESAASVGGVGIDTNADTAMFENDGMAGITIKSKDVNSGSVYFASASDNHYAAIVANYNNSTLTIGPTAAGFALQLTYGNGTVGAYLRADSTFEVRHGDCEIGTDNKALLLGGGQDFGIKYDGTDGYIETDLVAPSDLKIDCGTDKTVELQETVWDDYVTPIGPNNWRGNSNNPVLTKLFDDGAASQGVYAYVFSNGDEGLITVQIPHKWKEGTTIYPHIHFMCTSDVDPADNFGIEFEWAWADIGEDFPANSTLETNDISTGVNTDDMHKLGYVTAAGISGAGHTISSVLLCRIKRVAATGDDYAGGVAILDFDIHYEINTIGSRQEAAK